MKRLLLLGGGHAHLHCLASFRTAPLADVQIALVSPFAHLAYSGMLPGWIAGHYALDEFLIPLAPLAQRGGVSFHQTQATSIDPGRRLVRCADGSTHAYDVLSIDTGPVADFDRLPGAREHAIAIRPLEKFIESWTTLRSRIEARDGGRIVIVGAGAAGVELALAMRHALEAVPNARLTLLSAVDTLPGSTGTRLERLMREAGIELLAGTAATRIDAGSVTVAGGQVLEAEATILSTGSVAAEWLQRSGLSTDAHGFLLTDSTLRVVSHPEVFAVGDCASIARHPQPKSGVHAVRSGPPLAQNLRRALAGQPLTTHVPRKRSLYLVSAGARYAVASWGVLAWQGAWVWRWKDRIDRAFLARYLHDPHGRDTEASATGAGGAPSSRSASAGSAP